MKWATRPAIHVDRTASIWVIRRFIDSDAEFMFVDDPDDVPPGVTPFDMRGVDLSHKGDDCTFETVLRRYDLTDPVLWEVAAIVHEADVDDGRYDAPEARGLDVILRGLTLVAEDERIVEIGGMLFDGLYELLRIRQRGLPGEHEPGAFDADNRELGDS